jgi:hypothetical protein
MVTLGLTVIGVVIRSSRSPKSTAAKISTEAPPERPGAMHAPPYEHNASITTEFDKFSQTTSVTLKDMPIYDVKTDYSYLDGSEGKRGLRAFFIKDRKPASFLLTFTSESNDWRYLRFHDLQILADGERVDLPPTTHTGDVLTGYVSEWISVSLSYPTFMRLVNAEKLEMRLGITELKVTSNHQEALRDLANKARE